LKRRGLPPIFNLTHASFSWITLKHDWMTVPDQFEPNHPPSTRKALHCMTKKTAKENNSENTIIGFPGWPWEQVRPSFVYFFQELPHDHLVKLFGAVPIDFQQTTVRPRRRSRNTQTLS
jgi:hypothetical protein